MQLKKTIDPANNKELCASELRYRRLFETAQDGVFLVDFQTGMILDVNPFLIDMLGYSKEDFLHKHLWDVGVFKDIAASKENFLTLQKKGYVRFEDLPLETKTGKKINVEFVANAYKVDGTTIIQCNVRDITDRKKAEKDIEYLTSFPKLNPRMIVEIDQKDGVVYANPAALELFPDLKNNINHPLLGDLQLYFNKLGQAEKKYTDRAIELEGKHYIQAILFLSPRRLRIYMADTTDLKYSQDALESSELRYRRLFETAQDGILLIDFHTGMILDINQFLIDILGFSKAHFLKKYLWEIGVFKDVAASKENFLTLQKKGYVRFEDLPLETKTGKKINVEFVANAYKVDGTTIIQCNVRDITDRKKAELLVNEIKTRDEAILNSIGDAVFACDKNGDILLFNKMAEEMTGVTIKDAIGKRYNQTISFIKESDGKPCNDFIAEAIKNNKITKMTNHVLLVRKDGRKIPVADSAAPIQDSKGNIIGCVVVFHDVTRERQIDKAKTEFVSLASHQLRTPLSTINWYAEMLLSEDVGKVTAKQKKYTQEIYHASIRMVNLVNALLNVSRLELGTFVIEPKLVDIVKIAKICLHELSPQILKKNLIISQKYDKRVVFIKVDSKLLTIIFQNFLSNSVKYTHSAGKIGLTISKEKDNILITVSDNGVGIPAAQQKQIFEKLFRADNVKKIDPDGTGLGLYIVKEIIDYAGGKVWFESVEGKGTIFYASLPLSGMVKKTGSKTLI